ncbi:terpene cyclase/mutase family protein [Nocardioides solisilvae]|uniref:terpene cyclase/mutase family protein n=1 Tax=Nocardioides solisilvae TaxID=1542435 RepID=UPI000D7480BC|nr:terpene cyclase/mutase family protein [Nocardioides solisilvae]
MKHAVHHPVRHGAHRRVAAIAASVLLVAAAATACADGEGASDASPPAEAGPAPVELAAAWLLDQRNADGLLEVTTEWEGETTTAADPGGSVDLVLGLSATGLHAQEAAETTDAVAADLPAYVGTGKEVYSGASAKALALALDQGRDPEEFGGLDLRARVEETVVGKGPAVGRLQDRSEYGDYANSIGQAYAAAALTRVGSDAADEVTAFLLQQQCEEGFFRLAFSDPGARDQTCDGDRSVSVEQAPDTTALVVLQLAGLAEEGASGEVDGALDRAAAWLLEQQAEDGSFSDPENGTNTNTTGLAGWALAELGEDDAAARAAEWLQALQVSEDDEELADEAGAVAYDAASLEDARSHGLDDPLDRSPWVVAAVQAFPALAADGDGEE